MQEPFHIVIIEDDYTGYRHLSSLVKLRWPHAHIYPQLQGIAKASHFFDKQPPHDLIFADLELEDGSSFDLWRRHEPQVPVIYTTGFKHYWSRALQHQGIDYLLKPIDEMELNNALEKYLRLRNHFSSIANSNHNGAAKNVLHHVVVKLGGDYQLIAAPEIVALYSDSKVVYLISRDNRKWLCQETNLTRLSASLDAALFFKASRKFVINIQHIDRFHSDEQSRISVQMKSNLLPPVRVSQDNAAQFRKWVGQR